MDCPLFVGPAVVGRTQVEFYCDVQTAVTNRRARFDVVFLFDCETDVDVPVVTVDTSSPRATLHERHLGTRLHKTVLQRICVQLRASADSVTLPAFAAARRAADRRPPVVQRSIDISCPRQQTHRSAARQANGATDTL